MKSTKALIILISLLLISCSSNLTPEPTSTPEPTITPTNTLEPTSTPEYCNPEEYTEAYSKIHDIFSILQDQLGLTTEDDPDYTEILTELTKQKNNLTNTEVPECMTYAKELLLSTFTNAIESATYYSVKEYTEATRYIQKASVGANLFVEEILRLEDCFPYCEP